MSDKFDELSKGLALLTSRRQALKKFGVGLAVMTLACFGLANRARAVKGGCKPSGAKCRRGSECCSGYCNTGFKYRSGTCY